MRNFNPIEEGIMHAIWSLEKGFPKEIMAHLEMDLPYNTILSTIRKLEKEGFIAYEKYGKSHQYYPLVKKKDYNKSLFKKLFKNYLNSSKEQLLSYFIEEENMDPDELLPLIEKLKSKSSNQNNLKD